VAGIHWHVAVQYSVLCPLYELNNDQSLNQSMSTCVCSTLVVASGCLQNLLQDCGSEFSLGERQGLQAIITTVDFMCVEEFDS